LQAKKGGFKDALPEDLLAAVLKEVVKRGKVDPSKVE
jgi:acetyl-CoA acyltransferase 1